MYISPKSTQFTTIRPSMLTILILESRSLLKVRAIARTIAEMKKILFCLFWDTL